MADARYVIIGNGVAGTTAAEALRKGDPNSRIALIGEEPHPLYNRVALPPYLKQAVPLAKVMIKDLDWHRKLRIDLFLETRVTRIDLAGRAVHTNQGQAFPFDKLLVATGGTPRLFKVPGAEGVAGVHHFQTLDDTHRIIAAAAVGRRAVVVGGSYIAYELAEGFRSRGLDVVWLIRGPRFLRKVLDEAGGHLVDRIARAHGVEIIYGEEVASVEAKGGRLHAVVTTGGRRLQADLVGAGLGLQLNTELLAGTGIDVDAGIVTDGCLTSSHTDVYAAGDVAQFFDVTVSAHHTMGTWNNAATHGRVAGHNMLGQRETYESIPTYTSGLFDSKIAVLGATPDLADDVSSRLEAAATIDEAERAYRRLFFLDGRLVGAVLIGDMSPRRRLLQLIKARERVESFEAMLGVK